MKMWRVRVDFFVPGEDARSVILKTSEILEDIVDFGDNIISKYGRLDIEKVIDNESEVD